MTLKLSFALIIAAIFACGAANTGAATFTVTKTADTIDGTCNADCSLREAIGAANAASTDDTIVFDPSVFAGGRIINIGSLGLLNLNGNGALTIDGQNNVLINSINAGRVFQINTGAVVTLNGLTITGGNANGDSGGAIKSLGTALTITRSNITGNTATNGGAISIISGSLTARYNRIYANSASSGKALFVASTSGTVDVALNWFGCNSGLNNAACDTATVQPGPTVISEPRLATRLDVSASTVVVGQTSILTTRLQTNFGTPISAADSSAFIGELVSWGVTAEGSISNAQIRFQSNGTATATYTAAAAGLATVNSTFDAQTTATRINNIVPTAAGVSLSGRVTDADGRPIQYARVALSDVNGNVRVALTSNFGYFRFEDVAAGQMIVVSVAAKGHEFSTQVINPTDSVGDILFVAN